MEYHFTVDLDPDSGTEGFFSVFLDNGHGCSAEIAGKIGYREVAEMLAGRLNGLTQEAIHGIFHITF